MEVLEDYAGSKEEEDGIELDVSDKAYKATLSFEKIKVELLIKITRVTEDQDDFCIDFIRKKGDLMEFLTTYKEIKTYIENKFGYNEETSEDQK